MIVYLLLTIIAAFLAGMLFGYGADAFHKGIIGLAILFTLVMGIALIKFLVALKDAGVLH